MAYINVAEWSPDQVTDWIKGLDDSMYNYVFSFVNNGVGGHQLLNIRPYELEQLGMDSIGHQEIVLEAVENLRNFHYNLDKENLQFMALHVATAARSLHRQLSLKSGHTVIETQLLNDITRSIATIKPLVSWLDRSPFQGQFQYTEICRKMLRLGLEMATIAQRERFVENPVEQIRSTAETLERLANYIIQDITDPMLLQPASLNLVTLKKRESELGFNIETSYHGVHRVTDIKHNSPAHNSGKIEDGDEIVQINYQTIVGWQYKTVILQLRESLPDVLLTLKKRPKHTKIYGQIYMQPYRLPSKKRNVEARWGENAPSPRSSFLTVPENTFKMALTLTVENEKLDDADTDSICSDIMTPTDSKVLEKESRLYYPKPRTMLQRRNTICGDELIRHKYLGVVPYWLENRTGTAGDPSSPSLRDKSVSFGFGLEITPRPSTCIGIGGANNGKYVSDIKLFADSKKLGQVIEQPNEELDPILKSGVSKVVRFDSNMKVEDYPLDEKYTCNIQNTILETFEPIPFADEDFVGDISRTSCEMSEQIFVNHEKQNHSFSAPLVETVNVPLVTKRGRLDKSHSTPTYDNTAEVMDMPPAIEPRKENHRLIPPVPPPRPRKQNELDPAAVPVPPPKPPGLMASMNAALSANQSTRLPPQHQTNCSPASIAQSVQSEDNDGSFAFSNSTLSLSAACDDCESTNEASELHTPTKSRVLTLKKKHSLISKRRNVNLKILGTGDIQGYLYRRTKDKRGVTFWARLYFVMLDTILYGFRLKEANKATCVIFLPGFTVSLAKEVHSKPFAFKVYHSAKTFYFAAESQDALSQWVDFIRQATLSLEVPTHTSSTGNTDSNSRELFSENESSSEENESIVAKNLCTPSPQAGRDLIQTASTKAKANTTSSSKSDRRYLGSLRKLTKGSLHFKSSSASEKKLSDIPVPTEQYRSYRKVPGGSFGIQIGANTPGYYDTSSNPFNISQHQGFHDQQHQSQTAFYQQPNTMPSEIVISPPPTLPQSQPSQRRLVQAPSNSYDSTAHNFPPEPTGPPAITLKEASTPSLPAKNEASVHKTSLCDDLPMPQELNVTSPTRSVKKLPYNFIHASNPNLVEFDFHTSRTLDYNLPKINSSNAWEAPPNIQGFVTLKDLMLQKQEEEAQEMYNNRVLLGVERKEEYKRNAAQRGVTAMRQSAGDSNQSVETPKVSKTQSRSLPKPPDYEISFKPDDEDIQLTRTKEGLKLRDFGYELISGDEPLSSSSSAAKKYILSSRHGAHDICATEAQEFPCHSTNNWTSAVKSRPFILSSNKNKKHTTGGSCSSADVNTNCGGERRLGSFKKKGKLDSFKSSSEKIFQFGKNSSANAAGMTMTLPLNKRSNNMNDGSVGGNSANCCSGTGIKKSQTYNKDLKDKAGKYDAQRKNSAPMPIFSKLSFSSGSSSVPSPNIKSDRKDKKVTSSPLLHRTIFGHHMSSNIQQVSTSVGSSGHTCTGRDYDQEIFTQVIFPKKSTRKQSAIHSISNSDILTAPDVAAPPPPTKISNVNANDVNPVSSSSTTEYPDMECPPVFEPDIYSLTDPNASLLLRRSNNNNPNSNNIRNRANETENN